MKKHLPISIIFVLLLTILAFQIHNHNQLQRITLQLENKATKRDVKAVEYMYLLSTVRIENALGIKPGPPVSHEKYQEEMNKHFQREEQ